MLIVASDMRNKRNWSTSLRALGLPLLLLAGTVLTSRAQIGVPPVIAVQPLSISVLNGGNASFLVVVVSVTKATYQWRFNGVPIPGATQSTYTRTNITAGDAGNYSVVIQNAAGSVTSANALLLWLAPLTTPLTLLLSDLTASGIKLQLAGPAGSNYVIMASSDLENWTPISTNSAPNGTVTFTDTSSTNHSRRFYKGLVQ